MLYASTVDGVDLGRRDFGPGHVCVDLGLLAVLATRGSKAEVPQVLPPKIHLHFRHRHKTLLYIHVYT